MDQLHSCVCGESRHVNMNFEALLRSDLPILVKSSKCGQKGHEGKMAPSVDILVGRVTLKCNYTEMTAFC